MRFAVEESLRGNLGLEINVETGSGGGDCGTPLEPGERFLIFAYRSQKDEKLWTGLCSGNRSVANKEDPVVAQYRNLIRSGTASVFGKVRLVKPSWGEDDLENEGSDAAPVGE